MRETIYKYWSSRIEELTFGHCFRCNYKTKNLQLAHINARVNGGNNTAENLHLLCRLCHTASELLEGDKYLAWFKSDTEPIKYYRELLQLNVSSRTSTAMAQKRKRGEKTGGDVPFGYRLLEGGRLAVDPEEQKVLELIRKLREAGESYRKIGAELQRRGILTRRGKSVWNPQVVKNVLIQKITPKHCVA
jgi:hypothetical protein